LVSISSGFDQWVLLLIDLCRCWVRRRHPHESSRGSGMGQDIWALTDVRSSLERALALLGEVRAMVEKMATIEEAKKAAPPDVLPPSPPSNGQCLPPPYVPPPNRVVLGSVGSARAEELWRSNSPPKALCFWTTGPHHQDDPRKGSSAPPRK
jgi:hypothetical protein